MRTGNCCKVACDKTFVAQGDSLSKPSARSPTTTISSNWNLGMSLTCPWEVAATARHPIISVTDARIRRPDIGAAPKFANMRNDDEFSKLAGLKPLGTRSRDDEWRCDIAFLGEQVAMLHVDPEPPSTHEFY